MPVVRISGVIDMTVMRDKRHYRQDSRADKGRYWHNRRADSQCQGHNAKVSQTKWCLLQLALDNCLFPVFHEFPHQMVSLGKL